MVPTSGGVDPDCWWNRCGTVLWLLSAQEGLDDDHAATAAGARMLWRFWLLGRGAGSFDGIDRDERHCEQLAGTSDILGAGLAGEQTLVADGMKAPVPYIHHEPPAELRLIARHPLLSPPTSYCI